MRRYNSCTHMAMSVSDGQAHCVSTIKSGFVVAVDRRSERVSPKNIFDTPTFFGQRFCIDKTYSRDRKFEPAAIVNEWNLFACRCRKQTEAVKCAIKMNVATMTLTNLSLQMQIQQWSWRPFFTFFSHFYHSFSFSVGSVFLFRFALNAGNVNYKYNIQFA